MTNMRHRAEGGDDLCGVLRRESFAAAEGEASYASFLNKSAMNSAMMNPLPHDPDRLVGCLRLENPAGRDRAIPAKPEPEGLSGMLPGR